MELNQDKLYMDLTQGLGPTPNQKATISYLIGQFNNTIQEGNLYDIEENLPEDFRNKYIQMDTNDLIHYLNSMAHTNIKDQSDPEILTPGLIDIVINSIQIITNTLRLH